MTAEAPSARAVNSRIANFRDLTPANGMIENVVGTFELPLAMATNFQINRLDYLIPMVVEEPSVVAAASCMARIARGCGGFSTSSDLPLMRAQVLVLGVADPQGARHRLLLAKGEILASANARDSVLLSLGGGCRNIEVRNIEVRNIEVHVFPRTPRGAIVVMHLIVDVRDAMGANTVNTMAEAVAPLVERITGSIEMPMALGLVGWATKTHPLAQAALRILGVKTAQELAEVTVAVGLAHNMAAMRALATEGIQRGHMAPHARNIAIVAGAEGAEVKKVAAELAAARDVRTDRAREILAALRGQA